MAKVLKYSKAIPVSNFVVLRLWKLRSASNHEVVLNLVSLVCSQNPEFEGEMTHLMDRARKDSTLTFSSSCMVQVDESYRNHMEVLIKTPESHPEFEA